MIDGIAGLWCSNLGHGRQEVAESLAKAASQLDYFHTFNAHTNKAQEQLSEKNSRDGAWKAYQKSSSGVVALMLMTRW